MSEKKFEGYPTPWKHKEKPLLPVVMRTDIMADCIFYEVRVSFAGSGFEEGENEAVVWQLQEPFDKTHRRLPAGPAFREAAKAQQRISAAWVRAIKEEEECGVVVQSTIRPQLELPSIFMLNEHHTTHVTKAQVRKERKALRKKS
jgi:hypothetical protein